MARKIDAVDVEEARAEMARWLAGIDDVPWKNAGQWRASIGRCIAAYAHAAVLTADFIAHPTASRHRAYRAAAQAARTIFMAIFFYGQPINPGAPAPLSPHAALGVHQKLPSPN